MSSSIAGHSGPSAAQSASQQAQEMTRSLLRGLSPEAPAPGSAEEADMRAAEAFIGDIEREIAEYDIANAKAMEAYARKCWSRVPWFGRHARRALQAEAAQATAAQNTTTTTTANTHPNPDKAANTGMSSGSSGADTRDESVLHGGLADLDLAAATAALATPAKHEAGRSRLYLHKSAGQTREGFRVERTSAVDADRLRELTGSLKARQAHEQAAGAHRATTAKGPAAETGRPAELTNTWLFKRHHPGWVPIMQRRWVPWLCVGSIVLIWTPDVWKLRTLYFCDYQYARLRRAVHSTYWRLTMSPEDYATLMAELEAQKPLSVKATNCPF